MQVSLNNQSSLIEYQYISSHKQKIQVQNIVHVYAVEVTNHWTVI